MSASKLYPLLLAAITLPLLIATACPSVDWWNSAYYATCAHNLGIPPDGGSILLVLLGRVSMLLFWFIAPARAVTLVGVLAVATAAVVFYATLRELLRHLWPERATDAVVNFASFAAAT